jgi:UDP:flavonoid glycosyltransferase YjiC (YdhE family)
MRVLFIPFPLPTHCYQQMPVAWALRSAGHEVRIASAQPGARDAITRTGMIATEVGGAFDLMGPLSETVQDPFGEPPAPGEFRRRHSASLEAFGKVAELLATDLTAFARWWKPDLVITDPMVTVAPLISETLGIPLVRHLFGPDIIRQMAFPGSGSPVEGDVREVWPARLVEIYDRFGIEVRADYAVRTIDQVPTSLQLPGGPNRLPVRYVPYNGPGVVPEWLRRAPERRRVCVTWGTVASKLKGDKSFLVPDILEALSSLDVEVVATLSTSDRELLGEPPSGVRVVDSLPLHLLLPSCDVLVQQGGAGAMLTAASVGVPQVCVGQYRDQWFNAELLAATGAGVDLSAQPEADAVKAAVSTLLSDTKPAEAAARLRDEIQAMPPPAGIVPALEELV